jgi:hypothetical protein
MFAREYLGKREKKKKKKTKTAKLPADVLKDQPSTTRPYRACGASITTYINLVVESFLLRPIRTFFFSLSLSLSLSRTLVVCVCVRRRTTLCYQCRDPIIDIGIFFIFFFIIGFGLAVRLGGKWKLFEHVTDQ